MVAFHTSTGAGLSVQLCQRLNVPFFSHPSVCVAVNHCGFNLYFSNGERCRTSSNVFSCPLCILFGETSVTILCSFFFFFYWVVYFLMTAFWEFFVLSISPSSDMWFENILSQHVAWAVVILTMSHRTKLFHIAELWFSIFFFFGPRDLAFGIVHKKISLTQGHKNFFHVFWGFTVLGFYLVLWSILSYFFVYGERYRSKFIFCMWIADCFSTIFRKGFILLSQSVFGYIKACTFFYKFENWLVSFHRKAFCFCFCFLNWNLHWV